MAKRGQAPRSVSEALHYLETRPERGAIVAALFQAATTHREIANSATAQLSAVRQELVDVLDQQEIKLQDARTTAANTVIERENATMATLKAKLFDLVGEAYRAAAGLTEGVGVIVALDQKGVQPNASVSFSVQAWEASVTASGAPRFAAPGPTTRDALRGLLAALQSWTAGQHDLHHARFQVADGALTRAAALLDGPADA